MEFSGFFASFFFFLSAHSGYPGFLIRERNGSVFRFETVHERRKAVIERFEPFFVQKLQRLEVEQSLGFVDMEFPYEIAQKVFPLAFFANLPEEVREEHGGGFRQVYRAYAVFTIHFSFS
jgi:hypothetical protein